MAKKTSRKKRKGRKKGKTVSSAAVSVAWRILVVILCLFSAYLIWLDYRIQSEFKGRKWSVPASVYSRALDVFPGQSLSLQDFEKELIRLGYIRQSTLSGEGQYLQRRNVIVFRKRSFRFDDAFEPAQQLEISFITDEVKQIKALSTNETLPLIRLEPQLIAKIYPHHNEDRVLVPYDKVPVFLVDALIAVEDRDFFSHSGVDLKGILRAFYVNTKKGKISQGGSTLTQQLVKNFFLTHERSYSRKINEIFIALLLERRYNKADILSAYINEVYLGQHGTQAIHGFGRASEYYFARPLGELDLAQMAMLVGLVKGASFYNPFRHPRRALERRNLVLKLIRRQNHPKSEQIEQALRQPLKLAEKPGWNYAKYPAYVDLVKRQLRRDYDIDDLRNEGLRIFTTLDPLIQDQVERVAGKSLKNLEQRVGIQQGSLQMSIIVMDVANGEIKALMGGRDTELNNFNRALDARRPVGSLIKPLVYYTALSRPDKYNVLSSLDDSAISMSQSDNSLWEPRNYDRKSHDNVTMLSALSNSYNLATVRLGLKIGIDSVINTIRKLGIEGEIPRYPSLFLGTLELTLAEVVQVYQTFANNGFQIPRNVIRNVVFSDGKILQRYPLSMNQVLSPEAVFLTNFILTKVTQTGTAKKLSEQLPHLQPLAGKTGTTNDLRDSWFAGFGDDLLAVVWVGKDDNSSSKLTGASGAMQIWSRIMKAIKPRPLAMIQPEQIDWTQINNRQCDKLGSIPFWRGYTPQYEKC